MNVVLFLLLLILNDDDDDGNNNTNHDSEEDNVDYDDNNSFTPLIQLRFCLLITQCKHFTFFMIQRVPFKMQP
jgi:hypothetical protein